MQVFLMVPGSGESEELARVNWATVPPVGSRIEISGVVQRPWDGSKPAEIAGRIGCPLFKVVDLVYETDLDCPDKGLVARVFLERDLEDLVYDLSDEGADIHYMNRERAKKDEEYVDEQ